MTCKNQKSAWIFMGSTALFAAMEVMNWVAYKKGSEKEMAYYKDQDHDTQVKSLEAAAKQTEDAAKSAKTRAMLAKIAAFGMMASGAFAIYEGVMNLMKTPAVVPGTDVCIAMAAPQPSSPQQFLAYLDPISSPDITCYQTNVTTGLEDLTETKIEKELLAVSPTLYLLKNLFTGKAQAQGQITSIVAGVGGGLLASFVIKKVVMDMKMFNAKGSGFVRGAIFLAIGGLALKASSDIQSAADELGKRANQYRSLATQMTQRFQNAGRVDDGTTHQEINHDALSRNNLNDPNGDAGQCFTGGAGELNVDPTCSCKKTNSCKRSEVSQVNPQSFEFGGSALADTTSALANTGSNLFRGNTDAAVTAAESCLNCAVRINELKRKTQDKANEILSKAGKKPVDWNKVENAYAAKIKGDVERAFRGLSDRERATLANMLPASALESGVVAAAKKDGEEATALSSLAVGTGALGNSARQASIPDFNFNLDDTDTAAIDAEIAALEAINADPDAYAIEGEDIHSRADANLFNIITTRYMKTAYPVFFDEQRR